MKIYALIKKVEDFESMKSLYTQLMENEPESLLILGEDYKIERYVIGRNLYYVHIVDGMKIKKICCYTEI